MHALRQVDFNLEEAEINALVGENGAGKSTLMKVLVDINPKDSGEIHYLGHLFNPRSPKMRSMLNGMFLDERGQNRRAEGLFRRPKINIDPLERLERLTFGKQQMEIAKAVSHNCCEAQT